MKRFPDNEEVQMKGIKTIGNVAQYGNRQQRQRNKGQAHMEHYNHAIVSTLQASIEKVLDMNVSAFSAVTTNEPGPPMIRSRKAFSRL